MTNTLKTELLTQKEVLAIIPISRSSMYVMISNGEFPAPIKIGDRRAFWKMSDIKKWYTDQGIKIIE